MTYIYDAQAVIRDVDHAFDPRFWDETKLAAIYPSTAFCDVTKIGYDDPHSTVELRVSAESDIAAAMHIADWAASCTIGVERVVDRIVGEYQIASLYGLTVADVKSFSVDYNRHPRFPAPSRIGKTRAAKPVRAWNLSMVVDSLPELNDRLTVRPLGGTAIRYLNGVFAAAAILADGKGE